MSDGIIDLQDYLRSRDGAGPPASTFALFGADGERSRFALPLWRAIYLASGERGGIVWQSTAGGRLHPVVVLDLAKDPPRAEFPWPESLDPGDRVPAMLRSPGGGAAVYLGEERERRWYLLIERADGQVALPTGQEREDIMFLAGECAGLLFLRGLAGDDGE